MRPFVFGVTANRHTSSFPWTREPSDFRTQAVKALDSRVRGNDGPFPAVPPRAYRIPISFSHCSSSTGHIFTTGCLDGRSPKAWPPLANRCTSAGTPACSSARA